MKKIIFALALLASFQIANAQQLKDAEAAAKKVEAAKAATLNEKKAANMATWIKLGQTYLDAYNAVQGNGYVGAPEAELQLLMTGVKPVSTEQVEVQGQPMTVQHYETADYYFSNGQLFTIVTTKPAVEDPLMNAMAAYKKAYELDVKAKKTKDISEAIGIIHDKLSNEAVTAYQLQDYVGSSKLFEAAANASMTEPYNQIDTNAIYNAGGVRIREIPALPAKVKAGIDAIEKGEKPYDPGKYFLGSDLYDELEEIHENPVKSGPEGYYVALDDPTAERPF